MSATRHKAEDAVQSGSKRLGFVIAAATNAVMLWISHQLLDWEWPGFLTSDFEDLLPIVTVSFGVGIVVNLVYAWNVGRPVKPLGELTNAIIGFAVALRTWQIFPFEFTGTDWSWLVRTILVVAMVGTIVGAVAQLANLAKGR
jgi:hypothetical protein